MGDWATTPDESRRPESCLVESGNQREQTEPSEWQPGSPTPFFISTMLTWLRQLGSCMLAVCKSVSVYKIKHICGSTQKSDESECTLTGSAVSVHVTWRESSFTLAGLLGKPTSWIWFLYSCLFVFGFQLSPLSFTFYHQSCVQSWLPVPL